MNIKRLSDCKHPRAYVWLLLSDLTELGANEYSLKDEAVAKTLGDGSEIIVMDQPGMMLFWSAETQKGYFWSSGAPEQTEVEAAK